MTIKSEDLFIDGVRVETYGKPTDSPPLLFIHGGCQGSWAWEKIAPRLADCGWLALCLNWYGHNGSVALPKSRALTRSLLDVTAEITAVVQMLSCTPILIAHSMGAVPSLAYAAANRVAGLVLLAPVLPAGFGAPTIDLAVDPTSMWMPPPALIKPTWWAGITDEESERYTSLLSPESPRAVLEATRWLCEVNTNDVEAPALVIAGGADALIPAEVESLAQKIDATFVLLEDEGHGITVNPIWPHVTGQISEWLSRLQSPASACNANSPRTNI